MTYSTLKPSTKRIKRSEIKRGHSKKQRTKQAQWNAITARKIAAGETCVIEIGGVCITTPSEGSHRVKRRFNIWTEDNHDLACRPCHDYIERNRAEAEALGHCVSGNSLPIQKFAAIFPDVPVRKGVAS